MSLKEGIPVNVVRAESAGRHRLKIGFNDGHVSVVDFAPFLRSSLNPETRRFIDVKVFRNFDVKQGNLVWGDYELCFPVGDLHEGQIAGSCSGRLTDSYETAKHDADEILAVAESKAEYATTKKRSQNKSHSR